MTDLEKMIQGSFGLPEFWGICRAAFSGKSGAELRKVLASLSHPLNPQPGRDPYETYLLMGRAQVVGLLLKYSEAEVTPATLISYEHRQSQGRRAEEGKSEGGNPAAGSESPGGQDRHSGAGSSPEGE